MSRKKVRLLVECTSSGELLAKNSLMLCILEEVNFAELSPKYRFRALASSIV